MTSINRTEIDHFAKHSDHWWDENGPFKPLHAMNPVRLQFIRDSIESRFTNPLSKLKILDCGCGGGLLSIPLARMGANVTGIDADQNAINIAQQQAQSQNLSVDFRCADIDELSNKYDVVAALEVIEHVNHPEHFIKSLASKLRSKGMLFVSTINRTPLSYAGAIVAAERILDWAPRGTHDWNKFITPQELQTMINKAGLTIYRQSGMVFHPLLRQWQLHPRMDINYIVCASL